MFLHQSLKKKSHHLEIELKKKNSQYENLKEIIINLLRFTLV